MKIITKLMAVLMAAALCFCFSACGENEAEKQNETKQNEAAQVEQKIIDILADTPACDGWAPSVGEMINTVFHDYEWDYEQLSGNENQYFVTITGTYSPNPDIPNLSQSGMIVYIVDVQTNKAVIHSDPNGIGSMFMVYIIN